MKQSTVSIEHTKDTTDLFILKHKDLDVAMMKMDVRTGMIEYILSVYLPEELPAGCAPDGTGLGEWWKLRAIPDSRKGIRQVLSRLSEETSQSLMLSSYGLSLTDHYWIQPVGQELYWKDLNFYENDFTDKLGDILTDSERDQSVSDGISKLSPSVSVNGDMKKKWIIRDGRRYLLKVNPIYHSQQAVNEVIAGKLHERLGWKNYVSYEMGAIHISGGEYPCSLSPMFTSVETEFVSAYQIVANYKVPNDISLYEALIRQAVSLGANEEEARSFLEYMILTDFILTNTDRHLNNFGFIYDPKQHRLSGMAPLFDTGNSLFYDCDVIPHGGNLLDIPVNSFSKREADQLHYVKTDAGVKLESLAHFSEEAEALLKEYTDMTDERAAETARTIEEKIEYLNLFFQGKKIWKKERYW
ncbi:MAG TPA: HipA domain-containing protein [Candidatus Mediterraneibacter intestinigallinarum]|nr:HipA domain-containing protein [Candidatus Mediterraneibacter intestinigallinarum]